MNENTLTVLILLMLCIMFVLFRGEPDIVQGLAHRLMAKP